MKHSNVKTKFSKAKKYQKKFLKLIKVFKNKQKDLVRRKTKKKQ